MFSLLSNARKWGELRTELRELCEVAKTTELFNNKVDIRSRKEEEHVPLMY